LLDTESPTFAWVKKNDEFISVSTKWLRMFGTYDEITGKEATDKVCLFNSSEELCVNILEFNAAVSTITLKLENKQVDGSLALGANQGEGSFVK
jgi:hypothetical protein